MTIDKPGKACTQLQCKLHLKIHIPPANAKLDVSAGEMRVSHHKTQREMLSVPRAAHIAKISSRTASQNIY